MPARARAVLVSLCVVFAAASSMVAADDEQILAGPDATEHAEPSRRTFGGEARGDRADRMTRIIESLDLDANQAPRVRDIIADHGGRAGVKRRAMQSARQKMRDAREANDRESMRAAQADLARLEAQAPDPFSVFAEIEAVLDDQQIDRLYEQVLREFRPPSYGPVADAAEALGRIELTDEQRRRVDTVLQTHLDASVALIREHGQELRAAQRRMRQSRTSNDSQALNDARRELWSLIGKHPDALPRCTLRKIDAILSASQREQLQTLRTAGDGRPSRDAEAPRDDQLQL